MVRKSKYTNLLKRTLKKNMRGQEQERKLKSLKQEQERIIKELMINDLKIQGILKKEKE